MPQSQSAACSERLYVLLLQWMEIIASWEAVQRMVGLTTGALHELAQRTSSFGIVNVVMTSATALHHQWIPSPRHCWSLSPPRHFYSCCLRSLHSIHPSMNPNHRHSPTHSLLTVFYISQLKYMHSTAYVDTINVCISYITGYVPYTSHFHTDPLPTFHTHTFFVGPAWYCCWFFSWCEKE